MPQLSKSQYLNYRKVALLYVLFIGFYFLTSPEEILRHYRSINSLLLKRIEYRRPLINWTDSISDFIGYPDRDVLAIGRSNRFNVVKYNSDLTLAINSKLESPDGVNHDFRLSLLEVFNKGLLPSETPNIISSSLLAAWDLRGGKKGAASKETGNGRGDEQNVFLELDQLLQLASRSIYLVDEKLILKWPDYLKADLVIDFLGFGSYVLSPGQELTFGLNNPGEFELNLSSSAKKVSRVIKVVKSSESRWYFNGSSRYLVLESGLSYVLAVQDINALEKLTSVKTNQKSVNVELLGYGQIRLEADPFYSGEAFIYFNGSKHDSLQVSFVNQAKYAIKLYTPGRNVDDFLTSSHVRLNKGMLSYAVAQGRYLLYGKMGLIGKGSIVNGEFIGIDDFLKPSIQLVKLEELELVGETGQRFTLDNSLVYKVPGFYGK